MKIKIVNNLDITLGTPINLEIIDNTNGSQIGTLQYGKIQTGGEEEKSLDLSGKTINNNLKFIITGKTLGSEGKVITINTGSSFKISVSFVNLKASQANAYISAKSFFKTDGTTITHQTFKINSAAINNGNISFNINNNFPFPITLKLTLPDVTPQGGGEPLTRNYNIVENSSISDNIDLSGYNIILTNDSLRYQTEVTISPESGVSYNIQSSDNINFDVSISDLYIDSKSSSIIVNQISIPDIYKNINFDNFSSVKFSSGIIKVRLKNNFPISIGSPFTVELIDGNTQNLIGTLNFGKISPGNESTQTLDLSGKTISNNINIKVTGQSSGSEGNPVSVDPEASCEAKVSFENLVAEEANAKIPAQTYTVENKIKVNSDSLKLNFAQIESGLIKFNFNNNFNFPIYINLKIPNIVSIGGDTLNQRIDINPNSQQEFNIDLENYIIIPINDSLTYKADVSINPDPNQFITIRSTDFIKIDATVDRLKFKEVNASVNLSVDFPEIDEELLSEPPDELKNFNLDNVIFTLIFENMPANLSVDITIISIKSGKEKILPIKFGIAQGVKDSVVLDKNGVNGDMSSPTIVDLINDLPERIKVSGNIKLFGDNVSLKSTEKLNIKYKVKVPFQFSLNQTSIEDTVKLDLDDDTRDILRDNLVRTNLIGTIVNNTPLGGELMISAGDSVKGVYQDLLTSPVGFDIANINASGFTTSPKETNFTFELTKEKFLILANANKIIINVTLYDVAKAAVRSTDYIIVKDVKLSGTGRVYIKDDNK
ncbi:hypothetical protein DRQ09_07460 [candidate division KSB1 bacterium]|nr:MAG: hypothetical protein DRQ09_07460 [candidate division KSB1 bacterium]